METQQEQSLVRESDPAPARDGVGSRRRLLAGAMVGVGAGVIAGGGTVAAMTREGSSTLTVEVACLGPTARVTTAPILDGAIPELYGEEPLDQSDLAGSPFLAEGIMYPEGTISGDDFIPTDDGSLGMWLCRGFFINGPRRPEPHLSTDQTFHFGQLTHAEGIGLSTLATHGFEGGNGPGWSVTRLVTGGTGEYRGARGECRQTEMGRNSTLFPWNVPALNFRFDFDLIE